MPLRPHSAYPEPFGRRALLRRGALAAGTLALAPSAWRALADHGWAGTLGDAALAAFDLSGPTIITRAQWGADESIRRGTRSFAPVQKLIVHHTAMADDGSDSRARIRAIYRFHTLSNGWDDIGYNFLIDRDGLVYEGRWARSYAPGEVHDGGDTAGRGVVGAHAAGFNTGSVGVGLLGDFTGVGATTAAVNALVRLLAWKAAPRPLDPLGSSTHGGRFYANIAGHRDVGSTSCPGAMLYPQLPVIRRRVAAAVSLGVIGYRIVGEDGSVQTHGGAGGLRDLPEQGVAGARVRAAASTVSSLGAWAVGPEGGVFALGDARFLGSMGSRPLTRPMVGMAPTVSGRGYWLVASDGGIFSYGDARFFGSTGGLRLTRPIVGMSPTPTGAGYWLVASDGGIFSYGDARFFGSTGAVRLAAPVVGMAPTPSGRGYWLAAADGGVFVFGDARFVGSAAGRLGPTPVRSIRATPSGGGYWMVDAAGRVHAFGDAPFCGNGTRTGRAAVDILPIVLS